MEIKVRPHDFICHDAIFDKEKTIVTAIVVPIKTIIENEGSTISYRWSCNHVDSCENQRCIYSRSSKKKPSKSRWKGYYGEEL